MPAWLYKCCVIVATGQFDKDTRTWRPVANISWHTVTGHKSHTIRDLFHTFGTKQEGEAFAVDTAKAWVDEHLTRLRSGAPRFTSDVETNVREARELISRAREVVEDSKTLIRRLEQNREDSARRG